MLLDMAHRIGTSALCGAWYGAALVQAAVSTLPRPPHLSAQSIQELDESGFTVVPNWLSSDVVSAVSEDMRALEGRSRSARVGTRGTQRQDKTIRNSKLVSLHPPLLPLNEGRIDARLHLLRLMHALGAELNRANIDLPTLSQSDMELGYVSYPVGG